MVRKQLSDFEKGMIVEKRSNGKGIKKIAREMKRSPNAIRKFFRRFDKSGSHVRKTGSGRKRKTTVRDDRRLVQTAKKQRFSTASTLAEEVNLPISRWTVSRRLNEAGLKSCIACKKPMVSEKNRKNRLAWCLEHKDWTPEQWRAVLFSDESPFSLRFSGQKRVWRTKDERYCPDCMQGTVKHDAKINVSGSFAFTGVGDFHLVKGHMDQEQYRQIAIHHLVPSGVKLLGRGFTLQQDNDPKHTANSVKRYFDRKQRDGTLKLLPWPSQSPDLNPIENLWQQLELAAKDRRCNTKEELFAALQEEWHQLDLKRLQDLVESMPRRIEAVLKNNGYPTKY